MHRKAEKPGPRVVVAGAGPSGMMRAMIAERRCCSKVVICDKKSPDRFNIVKMNKNDYLLYFPIFPIMVANGTLNWRGVFAFSQIESIEEGMEKCLSLLGVNVDRNKEWMRLLPDATAVFWDAQTRQTFTCGTDIFVDSMGVHSPLAKSLGNQRKILGQKELVVIARYNKPVAPKKAPHLKEHLYFEDPYLTTTLSSLFEKDCLKLKELFADHACLQNQLRCRERKMKKMVFCPDHVLAEADILRDQIKRKAAEINKIVLPLLPDAKDCALPPKCIEVGYSTLEKASQIIGKAIVLWAGDSFATGHPREGQGINIALRAGAFAKAIAEFNRQSCLSAVARDYDYGANTQISVLLGKQQAKPH